MSFLVAAALAVALLVAAPLIAHLLRRGRTPERAFPPAALVSRLEAHSKERARLEDRTLLGLRSLMVVVLAVLGATPLVRCSRLSVDRPQGASIALALVIDDSHSMRALAPGGETRWQVALTGASQLLRSARDGDAVAIVLAGKPARVALSPTTDLQAARGALTELRQSDRASDLDNALTLARSALAKLERSERQVIVLGDLAGSALDAPDVAAPLEVLRQPVNDCGLVEARRQTDRLTVTLTCSGAARGARSLHVVSPLPVADLLADPDRLAKLSLEPHIGSQSLSFVTADPSADFELELTPPDDNPSNDRVRVSPQGSELSVAVVTDQSSAGVVTGGPSVIEQGLLAVRSEAIVRPLALLPDDARELQAYAALVVNDPPGLGPGSRSALAEWLDSGGVALGLLGPASAALQLSSTLEPFAERNARWEVAGSALNADANSLSWLGPEGKSVEALTSSGRMRLDGAGLPGSSVIGTWQDGAPLLFRRSVNAGLVLTCGLPASVDRSDLAVRPVFLALLDHLLGEAEQRRGSGTTWVGERWSFPPARSVQIEGPSGPLRLSLEGCEAEAESSTACTPGEQLATPELAGRYVVTSGGAAQIRTARIDEREITDPPGNIRPAAQLSSVGHDPGSVDASPELALVLLAAFAAELALRMGGEARRRRRAARALH
jgi:antitoxin (DNA-binding transcriptional repressor) of toxin-antitoxin stability system